MSRLSRASVALPRLLLLSAAFLCVSAFAAPAEAAHQGPSVKQTSRFLWGLAGEESGWNYYARNRYSGAFGKYQIMPDNWTVWSHEYIGDGWIDWSPANQEVVARAKVVALYDWLGSWRQVAYWWLTGLTDTHHKDWSTVARHYVRNVLSLMDQARGHHLTKPVEPSSNHWVEKGDLRLSTHRVGLHRKPGVKHPTRHAKPGSTFRILKLRTGPKGHVLWFKARNAKGHGGWVMVKKTLPFGS
jgi:hypothetical protein